MNELTLKDAIEELEKLSTGNWIPYEYSPEEAKLILNHINNLQSKIDKAIELLKDFKSNSKDVENEWAVEICELSIRKLKEDK